MSIRLTYGGPADRSLSWQGRADVVRAMPAIPSAGNASSVAEKTSGPNRSIAPISQSVFEQFRHRQAALAGWKAMEKAIVKQRSPGR